ncbi:hypothetical protein ACWM35_09480 [Neobacillus sp. K501]
MKLIEIYIQEVTRRIPEKSREDIGLELRSTIEDMLPDDYTEADVKSVLEKLGNPAILASSYRDEPMHLIGPRYFDVYVTLLKMILPIAVVISLISMIADNFFSYSGEEAVLNVVLTIIGEGIWNIISVGIQVFFWLTVVFAIIERTDQKNDDKPLTIFFEKWTPDDLKNIPDISKQNSISKFEVFGSLMWTAIWASVYFYANHLLGVYEGNGNGEGLVFITPALNQEVLNHYWPIVVVVIGLEIVLALYKTFKWRWTKKMAIFNTVVELVGTIVFIVIFMNPNLLLPPFTTYMGDLFSISAEDFKVWFISGIITIFIVSTVISIFDGWRKSRIR